MKSISTILSVCLFAAALLIVPAQAQDESYEFAPVEFAEPLSLKRGDLAPQAEGALYLTKEDRCHLVTEMWGWEASSCSALDAIIISASDKIDTLVIEKPNSDGYVSFEDWENSDRDKEITAIWDALVESTRQQGEALGEEITMDEWLVQPTLDQDNQYLYYATKMTWGGEPQINIKASIFDRRGYVTFMLVPIDNSLPADAVKATITETLAAYTPKTAESYADFTEGDKVASVGVLGVLAGIVGVKYGKVVAAGLMAVLLGLAKKFWFLLLVPLIALKNVFFKPKDKE